MNRRVTHSPKGLLHTYSAKNLCAKQLTDEQPAQKSAKFRNDIADRISLPFTTLMMPYLRPVVKRSKTTALIKQQMRNCC